MSKKIRQAYQAILGEETGYVHKDTGGKIKIALAYPNTYYVGMSNLGLHTMYRIFNARPDTLCERVFLPSRDMEWLYRNSGTPLLTLESQTPVKAFDILAFSCSFENDYLNCLKMMALAGLPLQSSERDVSDPIVVMGGACTFFNTEPMAPFMDCFICGEGERIGNEFLDSYRDWYESGGSKQEFCHALLRIPGMYVPVFYDFRYDHQGRISDVIVHQDAPQRIRPRIERDTDLLRTGTAIFNQYSEFSHMYLLEVTRGCPRGCRFCLLSQVYKPFRYRRIDTLLRMVQDGMAYRERIGLVGASLTDYPDLDDLCEGILSLGGRISLSSMRIGGISDRLMDCLVKSGIKTITLAPEAGSERLRSSIGKEDITDEKIMTDIGKLLAWKVPHLKIYFMIGLPGETETDVEAIVNLIKKVKHHAVHYVKRKKGLFQISISVSSFVPKPLTPFQFYPMESIDLLKRKIRYLGREFRDMHGVHYTHDLPKWSYIQGLLSRGDRRVGEILLRAQQENGDWHRACIDVNMSPDFYLYRRMGDKEIPPWVLWVTG